VSRTLPLDVTVQVTLDGSGGGQTQTGPTGQGEIWNNLTVHVNCSTNVNEAQCLVYVGSGPPQGFADGTTWGSTGDSSDTLPSQVSVGQFVSAVWSGGDAGTTGFLRVTGTRLVA